MDRRRALMAQKIENDPWVALFQSIDAGTYATDYALGDLIPLDLGTGGILNMQIAGFDADTVYGTSRKAPITFISKELYKISKRYNPAYSAGTIGTGTLGGWTNSELKAYMDDTIFPMIPVSVSSHIVSVLKYSRQFDANGTEQREFTSGETLWIPSFHELTGKYDRERYGPFYTIFSNNNTASTSRVKGKTGGSNAIWWTRTAGTTEKEFYVAADGSVPSYKVVTTVYAFPVCFCVE